MVMIISILVPSIVVFLATTVLEKVLLTVCLDVSACNYCDISIVIECTARPIPLRNVTVQPSQTSLLIEWMEPEQVYGRFDAYYVEWETQTRPRVSSRRIYSITETAVNITGLSVFTRYKCCVTVFNYEFVESIPNCMIATTAPGMIINAITQSSTLIYTDLPTAPLAVNITELTYKSIQLEWSRPQPINGIISHYTITCLQADGTFVSLNTTADGLETVSNLQQLTNYTCCISATNQVGEGNDTCVESRTKRGMLIQYEQAN